MGYSGVQSGSRGSSTRPLTAFLVVREGFRRVTSVRDGPNRCSTSARISVALLMVSVMAWRPDLAVAYGLT
jgi:hypothetical protein